MSATLAPFGLVPAFSPSGIIRPTAYSITSGYASNILQNQPVKIDTDGGIIAAAAGDAFIGTFAGVEWTDSDGVRRTSNKWTASTTGTAIVAYCTLDPSITYQVQANATIDVGTIGSQYNFGVITAGSTTTGLSAATLDVSSNGTNKQLRIVGLNPGPDNAWADAYPIVLVQISQHQNVADKAQY